MPRKGRRPAKSTGDGAVKLLNIDGKFLDAPPSLLRDGAFLFGDALFETLKAKHGKIQFIPEHLDRMEASAKHLQMPFTRQGVETALNEMQQRLKPGIWRIRLTLTRGDFGSLAFPEPSASRFLISASPSANPRKRSASGEPSASSPPTSGSIPCPTSPSSSTAITPTASTPARPPEEPGPAKPSSGRRTAASRKGPPATSSASKTGLCAPPKPTAAFSMASCARRY